MKSSSGHHRASAAVSALTVFLAVSNLAIARPATLTLIPSLPETLRMYPSAMAPSGSVMVGEMFVSGVSGGRPFRWTPQLGVQNLRELTNDEMLAVTDISDDGLIYYCLRRSTPSTSVPALWTEAGGFVDLPNLGRSKVYPTAISPSGNAAVGSLSSMSFDQDRVGYLWTTTGGMVTIDVPFGYHQTWAFAVSADGLQVVGGATSFVNPSLPIKWTLATGTQFLGLPPGITTAWPNASAEASDVIVGFSTSTQQTIPLVWRNGIPARLDAPTSPVNLPHSNPLSVSADGSVIAGSSSLTQYGTPTAMLWSTFGVKPLRDVLVAQGVVPPPGFDLPNEVRVTSDRTRVFGNYRIQGTSNLAAFIATIRPPCPGDITANGTVATDDLVAFLAAFGTCPGAPSYTSGADFSGPSNCIDTADLVNLLARFGQVCP